MKQEQKSYLALSFAIGFAYFAFGAITNVAGAIIPKIRESYGVSSSLSVLLAAVFFIAYGITSIPWGIFMEKFSKKTTLITGSIVTTLGVLLFAAIEGFSFNLISMFLCGIGITGIQVALNPLVGEISEPTKYSRNLTAFMVINGIGSYLAPQLVTFIKNSGFAWTMTYWVFTALAIIMTIAITLPKYPSSDKTKTKENHTLTLLRSHPLIYLYALGIFLYVGVEVGVANTVGFYLNDKLNIDAVFGDQAEAIKNTTISNYWGGLLVGRLISSFILDRISGKKAIMIYISLAAISLFIATKSDLTLALWAFPVVGFFLSVMFPTIYSLGINSFAPEYSSAVSGVLCTAIIGGAVIGPAIAKVAELNQGLASVPNWDAGLLVAFACYLYLFLLGAFAPEKKTM